MTPAGKLPLQDWLTAPETRALVAALAAEGDAVRFVGGCVRDAVAGRPVKDIDLATPSPPERVTALLESAGIKAVPTGIEHGTVTAVVDHLPFEITTLRRDLETDGRRAKVAFTDDWTADAARRDFTMNALSCAPDGTLYDPFDGLADLRAGRVRFVGDPRARIEEDYLRLLRFFRFQAHYGHEPPAPALLAVAMEMAPGLANLSGERLRQETLKLLEAPQPLPALEAMIACGVAAHYLPEVESADSLAAFLALEDADAAPDPLLRLAALLPEGGAGATVARRLRLSRAETTRLIALTAPEAKPLPEEPPALRRRRIYYLGARRYGNLLRLGWARGKAAGDGVAPRERLAAAIAEARAWTPRKFPLGGKDLLERGIPSSQRLGEILAEVEDWWIEGGFTADREACLARLDALVAAET